MNTTPWRDRTLRYRTPRSPAVPLLVLAGYTVVFSFLAQRFFRWE